MPGNRWHTAWLTIDDGSGAINPGTETGGAWIRYEFDSIYEVGELWVWNSNQATADNRGLKDVSIEYSTTGGSDSSEWTKLGDFQFARATGAADYAHDDYNNSPSGENEVDFGGVDAKYVVITANSAGGNWGGMDGPYYLYGLSEVRFFATSYVASWPEPEDNSNDVALETILRWTGGIDAVGHDVYFGTDKPEVLSATRGSHINVDLSVSQPDANYSPVLEY